MSEDDDGSDDWRMHFHWSSSPYYGYCADVDAANELTLYKAVAKQLPANCIPPYKAENSYLPLYYLLLSSSLFTGVMKFIYGRRLINFIYGGVVLC